MRCIAFQLVRPTSFDAHEARDAGTAVTKINIVSSPVMDAASNVLSVATHSSGKGIDVAWAETLVVDVAIDAGDAVIDAG
jgi:hypothetical protein